MQKKDYASEINPSPEEDEIEILDEFRENGFFANFHKRLISGDTI